MRSWDWKGEELSDAIGLPNPSSDELHQFKFYPMFIYFLNGVFLCV